MLLGRDEERLALDRLLARGARRAAAACSRSSASRGSARRRCSSTRPAQADGMRVLRARGIESEARGPVRGPRRAAAPGARPRSTGSRRRRPSALAGALALRPATAQDRFAIGAATLSLLSACAEEAPLLVLVDDAHRLDGVQRRGAAVRRAPAARRPDRARARRARGRAVAARRRRPARRCASPASTAPTPRSCCGARACRGERSTGSTARRPATRSRCSSSRRRRRGSRAARRGAGADLGEHRRARSPRRLGRLAEPARRACSCSRPPSDTGDVAMLDARGGGSDSTSRRSRPPRRPGCVTLDAGHVEFRHPLVRSAIYAERLGRRSAAPRTRRWRRRCPTATSTGARGISPRAAIGPDAAASRALEQAGERAQRAQRLRRRGGAVRARRAAWRPTTRERARLLLAGGRGGVARRRRRAHRWRCSTRPAPTRATARLLARIDHARGYVAMRRGPVMDGYRLTSSAAAEVADHRPGARGRDARRGGPGLRVYAGDQPAALAAAARARRARPASIRLARAPSSSRRWRRASRSSPSGEGEAGAAAVRSAVAIAARRRTSCATIRALLVVGGVRADVAARGRAPAAR